MNEIKQNYFLVFGYKVIQNKTKSNSNHFNKKLLLINVII